MNTKIIFAVIIQSLFLLNGMAKNNLLENPGFENWVNINNPESWRRNNGKYTQSSESRSGDYSLRLDLTEKESSVFQSIELEGEQKLTLRAWVKMEGETGIFWMTVGARDAKGKNLAVTPRYSQAVKGAKEWTESVFVISAPPGTKQLTIVLRGRDPGLTGGILVDDVELLSSDTALENTILKAQIEPQQGGRIRSLKLKPDGSELTIWQAVRAGGLGTDVLSSIHLRDAVYEITTLVPNRHVLLRHESHRDEIKGLVIEKEYFLPEAAARINVKVRVINKGSVPREINYRVHNCLPPRCGIFTWPQDITMTHDVLRAYDREKQPAGQIEITSLAGGWAGFYNKTAKSGLAAVFNKEQILKAYSWFGNVLDTLEWFYLPQTINSGEKWETEYSLNLFAGEAPVIYADPDILISADLYVFQSGVLERAFFSLTGGRQTVKLKAEAATADNKQQSADTVLDLEAGKTALVDFPWHNRKINRVKFAVGLAAGQSMTELAKVNFDDLIELPEPPGQTETWSGLAGFFPYGDYLRGGTPSAIVGPGQAERNIRLYRMNYFNTLLVGEYATHTEFGRTGTSTVAELCRSYGMRINPRSNMLRGMPRKMTRDELIKKNFGRYDINLRKKFVEKYNDVILFYDIADEPELEYIHNYLILKDIWREIDPARPAVPILMAKDTQWAPYVPVYFVDHYPIYYPSRGPRDPWSVATTMNALRELTPAPVWIMLQTFGYQSERWALPTGPELRHMIYSAVAHGARGIFFHGTHSPPVWVGNLHYHYTTRDELGASTPAWQAQVEAGKHITAIGPALLETDYTPDAGFKVQSRNITVYQGVYTGPAVTVSALKQRSGGGYYLFVINQDVENKQQGVLTAEKEKTAGLALCDLTALAKVSLKGILNQKIDLAPGDCRIFYVGAESAVDQALAEAHKQHYLNELEIVKIELNAAKNNKLDTGVAERVYQEAETAFKAGKHAVAYAGILKSRAELKSIMDKAPEMSKVRKNTDKAAELLSHISGVYRDNFETVIPPEIRKDVPRRQRWPENKKDPRLQGYLNATAECYAVLLKLDEGIYKGLPKNAGTESDALLSRVQLLHKEVIPYVEKLATVGN